MKNTPMKVKSLSLSRRTQTPPRREESMRAMTIEENQAHVSNLDTLLNSPIARPSRVCSTPKHRNVDPMEDSPDQENQASPTSMFPCTQDSNEIAWDWQSGINKDGNSNGIDMCNKSNGVLSNTPKRTQQFLHKKRIPKSGSPLLNLTSKRKLAKINVAESIDKFATELRALSERIKAVQREENIEIVARGATIEEKDAESSSKQLGIYDMETQNVFDIHEAETLETDVIAEPKIEPEKTNSSVDDLFDDSIDACMVACSQEVENKLRLSSDKSKIGDSSHEDESNWKKMDCIPSTSYSNADICNTNIQNKSHDDKKATISNDKKPLQGFNARQVMENDTPMSQIPDDSFDECLLEGFDEADELLENFARGEKLKDNINTALKNPTNFHPKELGPKVSDLAKNSNQNNHTLNVSSNFKRKQQCLGSETCAATLQNRKFFKSKSLSDSYAGRNGKLNTNQNLIPGKSYATSAPITKTTSNYNLSKASSSSNLQNFIQAAGGNNNSGNKTQATSTVSYSYLRTSSDNLGAKNLNSNRLDPYLSKDGADKPLRELRITIPTSSQQVRCTAEEIERKRLEAKMRLEKNKLKKLMNSNNSANPCINSLPMKRPVLNNKRYSRGLGRGSNKAMR